jgi:hypothetical protein
MSIAQKQMMSEFYNEFFILQEKYWNPLDSDEYWDKLTDEAMLLIGKFQTADMALNNFLSNVVVAFLNSREEMIAN